MKTLLLQSLVLLVLTALGGLATKLWHPYAPVPRVENAVAGDGEVLAAEALRWEAEGLVVWVDARKRADFEAGHMPGAYLVNEYEWDDLMWESGPEMMQQMDKRFVVYCGNEDCKASSKIAEKLRERRFPEVYVLLGGWPALKSSLPSGGSE